MKTVGIIAEFNPFHRGHEYLIRALKKETGSDYAVIIMSGDYTQRGAPAILDKYTRTKMALMCGADLVLELPIYYSTSSAEFFAGGAVSIINGLNCIDFLGFGSESGDTKALQNIAGILCNEPAEFSCLLKKNLKSGMNYPSARADALSKYLSSSSGEDKDSVLSLISSPNDILGTEYIKALILQKSKVTPYAIKRIGSSYNDECLPKDKDIFASAKSIRSYLEKEMPGLSDTDPISDKALSQNEIFSQLPTGVSDLISNGLSVGSLKFVTSDDFSSLLHYKLLSEKAQGFEKYLDVSRDLSEKIVKSIKDFSSFTDYIMKLKSKDITYARISRALIHIVLNMTADNMSLYAKDKTAFPTYARILGFNRSASPLMKKIQEYSDIPVISTLSDAAGVLDNASYMLLNETIAASNIYDLISGKSQINEYAKKPVIISFDT